MADLIYGGSGDVRADLNSHMPSTHINYKGEAQIPGDAITEGLEWATDYINAALEPRYPYTFPIEVSGDVPSFINRLSNCIAAGWVIETLNPGPAPLENNKFVMRKEKCEELVGKIAEGDMEVPGLAKVGDEIYHTHEGRTPAADVDDIINQGVDSDLLDDIDDRRSD